MPVKTKQKSLTATECAVLGLLTRGPKSGYDLKKATVLPRLVEAGYVKSRRVAQSQRPDKQVYRITARGREALREWIEWTPAERPPDRNPLLLKLFFGELGSTESLVAQVRERREDAERLKAELNAIDEAPRDGAHDFYPG